MTVAVPHPTSFQKSLSLWVTESALYVNSEWISTSLFGKTRRFKQSIAIGHKRLTHKSVNMAHELCVNKTYVD
jgi:hypothetical protein